MRTLVIETATAACSVALIDGGRTVDQRHEVVGRGHAERLLPMIAELSDGGRADAILVDCGPGSFTGVRVGLAAAIALGIGWEIPVTGCSSMSLIAAAVFAERDIRDLAIVLEGGHGEVFMQDFVSPLVAAGPLASLRPEAALDRLGGRVAAGNGVRHLVALMPALDAMDMLPSAADAILLPPAFATLPPSPIYGRAPDARLPA